MTDIIHLTISPRETCVNLALSKTACGYDKYLDKTPGNTNLIETPYWFAYYAINGFIHTGQFALCPECLESAEAQMAILAHMDNISDQETGNRITEGLRDVVT